MLRLCFFLGFFDACAGFVHLVVCFFCFFWCLCRFCDSNLHQTCTGIKKTKKTKAWSSQNLHRHQKNQNNQNFAIYRPPALSRCSDFVFFGFFDACAGFVHLVVCFFWFFWCLCRFCDSYLHQTCTGIKKTKKNKAWSSQNLRRHQKKQNNQNFAIYRPPALSRCSDFGCFVFFDACAGFVHLVVWFVWFFWCLCRFCDSNLHQTCTGMKETKLLSSIDQILVQQWPLPPIWRGLSVS